MGYYKYIPQSLQIEIISKELPSTMMENAIWARKQLLEPFGCKIDIDNNLLPWVYNEESDYWISLNGNYSKIEPKVKRIKYATNEELEIKNNRIARKRAMKAAIENEKWSQIRKGVLERDNYTCQICGKTGSSKLHIHHILKRREGGSEYLDNLLTVCPKCHRTADTKKYNPEWEYRDVQ